MMASRSAFVICFWMKVCAAVRARELIGHGHRAHIEVDRQQAAVAVFDVAGAFRARSGCRDRVGALDDAGAGGRRGGRRRGGARLSSSFWNSKKLMVCGTPSSVMMKSFAVRPSIGLPFLSLTLTVSTTSCVLDVNFGRRRAGAAGCCCAGTTAAATGRRHGQEAIAAMRLFRMLEPHPQIESDAAHRVGRCRQAELRARDDRVPRDET